MASKHVLAILSDLNCLPFVQNIYVRDVLFCLWKWVESALYLYGGCGGVTVYTDVTGL